MPVRGRSCGARSRSALVLVLVATAGLAATTGPSAGAGAVADAATGGVPAVAWSSPSLVHGRVEVFNPAVVVSHGNVTAAWTDVRGVRVRTKPAGSAGWRPTQLAFRRGWEPAVAADRSGAITVLGAAYRRSTNSVRVRVARRSPGGQWSGRWLTPARPDRDELGIATWEPTFAARPSGAAVAFWAFGGAEGGPALRAEAAYRRSSGRWTRWRQIAAPESWPQAVAIGPGGVAAVVVEDTEREVSRLVRYADGRWHDAQPMPSGHAEVHAIGCTRAGVLVAAWSRRDRTRGHRVVVVSRLVHGRWTRPVGVSAGVGYNPVRLTTDRDGGITVLWRGLENRVKSAYRPTGGAFSAPVTVARAAAYGEYWVAANPRGQMVVAWPKRRPTAVPGGREYTLEGSLRTSEGTWTEPSSVSGERAIELSEGLAVGIGPGGTAAAVWLAPTSGELTSLWSSTALTP